MTLFNDPDTADLDNVPTEEGKDYVSILVGEGKKFADLNKLAASAMHKDTFIQKLIAEKREIEKELQTRQSVEDIYNKLKGEPPRGNPPPENRQEETGPKPEDIERIVQEAISRKTQEQTGEANLQSVTRTLEATFGPAYQAEVKKRINDIGVGEQFATELAKTNPKAFLKLVGADTPPKNDLFNPPRSDLRSTDFRVSNEKTYSYYENIRKTDPKKYATLSREMFEQASKLGDAFYN